jgi:transcriptional regulator with XRE-family HTH domain
MNGDQCRMARAALGWSLDDLAAAAKIGRATIARFETGTDARSETVSALKSAIEAAGVTIIAGGEVSKSGGPGVRFTRSD